LLFDIEKQVMRRTRKMARESRGREVRHTGAFCDAV
jgi:hypothetical protein